MQIKRLYVKNFRNIREQEFCFHENVNVLCGNNAQGKTNLCEAISLCMGPSFRTSRQSSYIPFSLDNSKEKCVIKMWFTTSFNTDSENLIEFTICNNKKEIKYNGLSIKSALELYGVLKYVVFIPEHLNLIKGVPECRREYLDSVAMMQTPVHLKKLSRYNKALKNKKGIKRFGSCILPMDETLVLCAVDLSGRPYLVFDGEFTVERVGYMDTEMVKEFFYAVSYAAGMNLHIRVLSGGNNHHMIEAMFKAFARALDEATGYDPRITDVLSTKGSL